MCGETKIFSRPCNSWKLAVIRTGVVSGLSRLVLSQYQEALPVVPM